MRNLVVAAALLLSLNPALAQPQAAAPGGAPGGISARPPASPELKAARKAMRQACMQDAHTLCSDSQTGGGKVMMCLRSHKDQVSDGCKAAFQHMRDVRRGV
jgi:hypothetical protein